MIKWLLPLLLALTAACASKPASDKTKPNDILINATADLEGCKFLGVVETREVNHWQEDMRRTAALLGATHIQSSGPNYVGFNEVVSGFAYKCR
tara:strand:+ start:48814 stop:49095 length:282 start_codon:yes stop_codon:yes gene_type:complete